MSLSMSRDNTGERMKKKKSKKNVNLYEGGIHLALLQFTTDFPTRSFCVNHNRIFSEYCLFFVFAIKSEPISVMRSLFLSLRSILIGYCIWDWITSQPNWSGYSPESKDLCVHLSLCRPRWAKNFEKFDLKVMIYKYKLLLLKMWKQKCNNNSKKGDATRAHTFAPNDK